MIEEFSGQFINVKNFCQTNDLIQDSTLVIVGLSGGIDSIYLFYFLLWLKQRKIINFEILAAHLNHQIREEADQDQAFVEQLCDKYAIPIFINKTDIPALAKQRQSGEEEAGRFARHQFFSELRDELQAEQQYLGYEIKVALGHHQDDLAESVVMNIGRGSGLSGISTLKAKENFYIRPLLNLSKNQICELVVEQGWQWVEDKTNTSDVYLRNRIRYHLLPLWNKIIGYDIKPVLARLATNLNEDETALIWAGKMAYEACLLDNKQLSLNAIQKLPRSIFKQVIERWLKDNAHEKILSNAKIEQIWQVVHGKHGNKTLDLGDNILLKRQKAKLILFD